MRISATISTTYHSTRSERRDCKEIEHGLDGSPLELGPKGWPGSRARHPSFSQCGPLPPCLGKKVVFGRIAALL